MKSDDANPRFLFTGNAVGVGGGQLFPVQNASSLPMIGGTSASSSGPFPSRGQDALAAIISYSSSSTLATGVLEKRDQRAETSVVSVVSEIRLAGDVHIAALKSQLKTTHSVMEDTNAELSIRTRLEIAGLSVKGYPLKVVLHRELAEMSFRKQFAGALNDKELAGMIMGVDGSSGLDDDGAPVRYSLVKRLEWSANRPSRKIAEIIEPNILDVKDIGYFHFGEVYRTGQSCRMTACRVYLKGIESRMLTAAGKTAIVSQLAGMPDEDSEIVRENAMFENLTADVPPAMVAQSKEDVDLSLAEVQSNGMPAPFPPPPPDPPS